jgi:hypothetical protein
MKSPPMARSCRQSAVARPLSSCHRPGAVGREARAQGSPVELILGHGEGRGSPESGSPWQQQIEEVRRRRVGLAQLVRFLMVELTHPGSNPRFYMGVAFTANYSFSGRRCPH